MHPFYLEVDIPSKKYHFHLRFDLPSKKGSQYHFLLFSPIPMLASPTSLYYRHYHHHFTLFAYPDVGIPDIVVSLLLSPLPFMHTLSYHDVLRHASDVRFIDTVIL